MRTKPTMRVRIFSLCRLSKSDVASAWGDFRPSHPRYGHRACLRGVDSGHVGVWR